MFVCCQPVDDVMFVCCQPVDDVMFVCCQPVDDEARGKTSSQAARDSQEPVASGEEETCTGVGQPVRRMEPRTSHRRHA